MALKLVTFGGLGAVDDSREVESLLGQRSRAALFVYLAVERRVSRELLTATFWPESDAENARHALRQSLYQLRKAVGGEWIESRAHELVMSDEVRADAQDFAEAVGRGDLEAAVRLYQGPFLDGVHLVDLQPWESWVDSRRAQYARAFRKACRDLLDARRSAGDLRGAIAVAEQWVSRDASDDEAQHRLIESLADAGERAEAIRQFETVARMLEADGLTPREETRTLVEGLRSGVAPLPSIRPASIAPAVAGVPASIPRPRPRWAIPAVIAFVVVVSALVWGFRRTDAGASPSSATTVAVLPFSVRGSEAAHYLGEGIVNLLGAALDGAGSIRPTDARATFAAVAEAGGRVLDTQHGDRVATRLGAGMYVLGDVVEAGGMLQIEAAAYGTDCPRARVRCRPNDPIARAVVSGPADSVFDLVDKLAAQLLGGFGDPAADRLLRTASLTTTSLPAFKAYLEGEGNMRAGQFERAADSYLAAIALDSTFAVAHYRLALAREWAPLPGEEVAANTAARHVARLSTRDRMLLEAFRQWRSGDASQADRGYRTILARYPDDVDAWFQLGEIQFHHGPLLGSSLGRSEEAWRNVLSYEPENLFALTHLARIAVVAHRPAALDSLLARFTAEQLRNDRRLTELVILRAVLKHDTASARALARDLRRGESFAVWRVGVFLTAFTPDPALMRIVFGELTADFPNPTLRSDLLWCASMLDLAAGRVDASNAVLQRAIDAERAVPANQQRSGFEHTTRWFAATLPLPYSDSTLARARRAAAALPHAGTARGAFEGVLAIGTPVQVEAIRQYSFGILSVRLDDTAAARSASTQLGRLAATKGASALTRDLDRGLRAQLAWASKRAEEALRLLDALEIRDSQGDVAATPFVTRVNERFLRAEILASLGRDGEALRWLEALGPGSVTEIPSQAISHLRQAEIHERLGRRDEAARHYTAFLSLWQHADAEFRPVVEIARRRLASLTHPD
jgi:DNA-binding SARP family transcriptional activator